MDWLRENWASVLTGLSVVFVAWLTSRVWGRMRGAFGKNSAVIRLRPPEKMLSPPFRFGVLHVRDGKDEVDDKGPLLNRPRSFARHRDELRANIRYSKRLGFQFKCFLDYGNVSFEEVKDLLEAAGYTRVEKGKGRAKRSWFLHPEYPTCTTIDGITNNFFYPQ